MKLEIVIALLTIDFTLGLAVGWLLKTWWTAERNSEIQAPEIEMPDAADAQQDQRCLDTLADISADMDGHADALRDFSLALADGQGDEQVDGMVEANRQFHREIDSKVDALTGFQVQQNGIKALVGHLKSYHGQVGAFCDRVEAEQANLSDGDVKQMLLSCVQDLLVSKQKLAADLDSARREIRDHKERLERARTEARADVLTSLPNRRAFEEKLAELEANNTGFAVAMFDADRFKKLNDTYGHDTGDAALALLGKVLRTNRRIGEQVYRFGGEEFALIIADGKLSPAGLAAERLRRKVESASLRKGNDSLRVTISGGVAESSRGESIQEVVKRADVAMYAAKQAGGNCTYLHEGNDSVRPAAADRPREMAAAHS